jgi:hypothetical protein
LVSVVSTTPDLTVGNRKTCRPVAGFPCTITLTDFGSEVEGFRGRCREDDNPFYALRFDYVLG